MTSVRSLPRLLNGNRYFLSLLLFGGLIFGCSTSKNSIPTNSPVLEPNITEEKDDKLGPIDTVQWTILSEDDFPPINSSPEMKIPAMKREFNKTYEIALLIPFQTSGANESTSLNYNKVRFSHFYSGIRMALSSYQEDEIEINISTYDTNRSSEDFDRVLQRMDRVRPDVIAGPYQREFIRQIADYAKEKRIPVISPWLSSTSITSDNLFYLQIRPNILEYYRNIVKHVNANHDRSRIWLIGRDRGQDENKLQAIQQLNQQESILPVVQPYPECSLSLDTLMQTDSLVFTDIFEKGVDAFVLPHYIPRDEKYLYSALRKIYAEKGDRDIKVYALPLALTSEEVDLNILKNLDINICEYKFPNPGNDDVKEFRKSYFETFGWLPIEDSYYGFDLMNFIIYGLENHGKYFHYYMIDEKLDLLQMTMHIRPFSRNQEKEETDYLMNSHLYMIEFDNDHFVVKDID